MIIGAEPTRCRFMESIRLAKMQLDRAELRELERDMRIEKRASELLDRSYSPRDPINIAEAMGEFSCTDEFTRMVLDKNAAQLGEKLIEFINEYWTKLAWNRAETEELS
jgi:hypothetical protein